MIKAVGDIGRDYYWEEPAHDIQKKWFEAQMDLARQVKLPIIIDVYKRQGWRRLEI